MRAFVLIALTGALALTAGAALAQAPSAAPVDQAAPGAAPNVAADPAPAYTSSDTLGDASKLKAGDANVVSNGPVPDTPQDRAQYGKPLSDAGKHTAPNGD